MSDRYWYRTSEDLPPEGVVVDTMISDIGGKRHKQRLKRQGKMWLVEDGSIYVYYTPTHWSEVVN